MAVWHISGLGRSPGAVTVPLTYIYVFISEALKGTERAKEFFKYSGEWQKTFGEEIKGAPEALVLFTSREIINGGITGEWRDDWFHTTVKIVPDAIKKYLSALFEDIGKKNPKFSELRSSLRLKNIYLIEVDYQDFRDCFKKAYITTAALKTKEIWINIIGGTNPINAGIFLASTFNASLPYKFYYIFQNNIQLMHPECKRSEICSEIPPRTWHEMPFISFDMGTLYKKLRDVFAYRERVSIGEIKSELQSIGYGPIFEKLRGRAINIEGDTAMKGELLKEWEDLENELKGKIGEELNASTWEKFGKKEGWLYTKGGL